MLCIEGTVQFFSLPVDAVGRAVLGELEKQQIIFEAETLSAVLAFMLLKGHLTNKRCLIFVDNKGTKFSLLKGSSENKPVDLLAGYFAEVETGVHTFGWLARVPSKNNVADPPSRNDVSSESSGMQLMFLMQLQLFSRNLLRELQKMGRKATKQTKLQKRESNAAESLWNGFTE